MNESLIGWKEYWKRQLHRIEDAMHPLTPTLNIHARLDGGEIGVETGGSNECASPDSK
ncbi:hypothetical protein NYV37_22900 [Escherichia coli]|nr:hypothetical protein [Escherichia coli]